MFDLRHVSFDIECPKCRFRNAIFFRQVVLRDVVICRGCKRSLQLDDYQNTARIAHRRLRHAVNDLVGSLRSLSFKLER